MTRKNQKILNDRKQIKILGTINFVDMPSKAMTEQELELEQIKSDNDYADYLNKSTISFRIF